MTVLLLAAIYVSSSYLKVHSTVTASANTMGIQNVDNGDPECHPDDRKLTVDGAVRGIQNCTGSVLEWAATPPAVRGQPWRIYFL